MCGGDADQSPAPPQRERREPAADQQHRRGQPEPPVAEVLAHQHGLRHRGDAEDRHVEHEDSGRRTHRPDLVGVGVHELRGDPGEDRPEHDDEGQEQRPDGDRGPDLLLPPGDLGLVGAVAGRLALGHDPLERLARAAAGRGGVPDQLLQHLPGAVPGGAEEVQEQRRQHQLHDGAGRVVDERGQRVQGCPEREGRVAAARRHPPGPGLHRRSPEVSTSSRARTASATTSGGAAVSTRTTGVPSSDTTRRTWSNATR